MPMYRAAPEVLQRSEEITTTIKEALVGSGVDEEDLLERAVGVLDRAFDAELAVWSDPAAVQGMDELAAAAFDVAATWVALCRYRFLLQAAALGEMVVECWPDRLEAWREHGLEVASTMGRSSGDYVVAVSYLEHYTGKLLDTDDDLW
jgi:hypothetical protein